MSRKQAIDGLTAKGAKIVAGLSELRDTIAAGEPIEGRFTVHKVQQATPEPDCDLASTFSALRRERQEKGISLAQLAERTGMSKGDLSKLETGKVANPTVATLRTYARALGKRLVISFAAGDDGASIR